MRGITAAALMALLAGCAANSSTKMASRDVVHAPHAQQVCLLRSALPDGIKYTVIGEVRGGKKTYGSVAEILPAMADEARKIGADAIVNLNTGQRFGMFAFARPVGSGTGVKLAQRSDLDCGKSGGQWH